MPVRFSLRVSAVLAITIIIGGYLFVFGPHSIYEAQAVKGSSQHDAYAGAKLQEIARVPCFGPRGQFLDQSTDDQLHPRKLDLGKCITFRMLCAMLTNIN